MGKYWWVAGLLVGYWGWGEIRPLFIPETCKGNVVYFSKTMTPKYGPDGKIVICK